MGKFKDFLKEEIGLGQLGARIRQKFNDPELGNQIGGAFASTDVTGSEQSYTLGSAGHPLFLPSTDLTIPSVEKTGRITILLANKNPIYVRLSDGTEIHFTYDEYRKIKGTPALGKLMTVIFQRHPEDPTKQVSKVDKCFVQD